MKKFQTFISLMILAMGCSQPEVEIYGSISGLVKNSQTSELLSGVRVTLSPGGTSQITTGDGAFSFEDLKSGEYSLTFSKDGFEDESSKVSVKTGVSSNVQITMDPIQPKLSVSANVLSFGEDATTLSLDISNSGKGILEWEVANNVDWIECSPTSGTVSTKTNTVVVSAKRDNLDQGNYSGSFVISSNGGSATISVSISINGITLQVEPVELDFGTITNSLQIKLTNTGGGTLTYEAKSSNDWLTLNKTSGNITTNDYITAVVSRQGLSAGKYDGNITFATKKGALAVPVKMEVVKVELPSVTVEGVSNIRHNNATLKGTIVSTGNSKIVKYGFCWSVIENPTISDNYSNLGDCSEPRAFESSAADLKPETKYYFRAYAENSMGISYSENSLFFVTLGTPVKPGVSTGDVTDVTSCSAKLKGSITNLGNVETITQYGHVWSKTKNPTIESASCTKLGETKSTCSFESLADNLETASTYYVRAYAVNEKGISYGEEKSFVTDKSHPVVQTTEVTEITHNSAICGGTITVTGGHSFPEVGVCYGQGPNPSASRTKVIGELKNGSFTCMMSGLAKETLYYARAYVRTDDGNYYYGNEQLFKTTKEITVPSLSSVTPDNIGRTSASVSASVISDGNAEITEVGFCWSTSPNPLLSDNKQSCTLGTAFKASIPGLEKTTTYYLRAYAINSKGVGYSEAIQFTTIPFPDGAVDLGLSVLWATCNLGSSSPTKDGDSYQWGGSVNVYGTYHPSWDNCPYHIGSNPKTGWTKYNVIPSYGTVDSKTTLDLEDDAAHKILGGGWRIPTEAEWEELIRECTWTKTTFNGSEGFLVMSKKPGYTDKYIFLPYTSHVNTTAASSFGGYYWSSSLDNSDPGRAISYSYGNKMEKDRESRYIGISIRPVSD